MQARVDSIVHLCLSHSSINLLLTGLLHAMPVVNKTQNGTEWKMLNHVN